MGKFARRIYLLDPRDLPAETIAVAFAKTSRSPRPFDEVAAELSQETSAQFHERWVVGYGHASIAEHAVLHLALENVSRLAIESIESSRLGSYSEKSTRYQKWPRDAYYVPAELRATALEADYRAACETLLDAYLLCLDRLAPLARERNPRHLNESESQWDARIRSTYADVARYLLPASAYANVGVTMNARTLEHSLRKMLSHPLEEVRAIAQEMLAAARAQVPTLLRYCQASPYLQGMDAALLAALPESLARQSEPNYPPGGRLELLHTESAAELRALASAWMRVAGIPYLQAHRRIAAAEPQERTRLAAALLAGMGRGDHPARDLEHVTYTFEAVADQGAFFEFKRHRMMSLSPAPLTCDLGYATPRWIAEAGLLDRYREALERAQRLFDRARREAPAAAAYVVPNAFRRRFVFSLNLREAYQFAELRSRPSAHFAIRMLALQMGEGVRSHHPLLAAYMRLPDSPTWQQLEEEHFLS